MGVDPSQEGVLGGYVLTRAAYLEVADEGPYEPKNQLEIATVEVLRTCVEFMTAAVLIKELRRVAPYVAAKKLSKTGSIRVCMTQQYSVLD